MKLGKFGRVDVYHDIIFFKDGTSDARGCTVGHFACNKEDTSRSPEFAAFCKWACEQVHLAGGQIIDLSGPQREGFKIKAEALNEQFEDHIYVVEFEHITR
jgi:hypothetical protein